MYNVCDVPMCPMMWSYYVILCSLVCMCVCVVYWVSCKMHMIGEVHACGHMCDVCGMHVWHAHMWGMVGGYYIVLCNLVYMYTCVVCWVVV